PVDSLEQSEVMLRPILGSGAALVFALALLCSGLASSITAGMAGGSIFAGIFGRAYDIEDRLSRAGIALTLVPATLAAFFTT
ncbi:divalent metal cation transporter, partial [Citrobacter sp. AAK_AS5]